MAPLGDQSRRRSSIVWRDVASSCTSPQDKCCKEQVQACVTESCMFAVSCQHCHKVLTKRGMEVQLLSDMSTILYSTDTKPSGQVYQVEWQDQTCGCVLCDFACSCGHPVGYQIAERCPGCSELEDEIDSGRHDYFLFAQQVFAEPQRGPFGDLLTWPLSKPVKRSESIGAGRHGLGGNSPKRNRRSMNIREDDTWPKSRRTIEQKLRDKENELQSREEALLAQEAVLFERDLEQCARERLLRDMAASQEEAERKLRSLEAEVLANGERSKADDAARQAVCRELANAEAQRQVDRMRAEAAIEVRQVREDLEARCAQRLREVQREWEDRLREAVEAERRRYGASVSAHQDLEESSAIVSLQKQVQALQIAQKRAEADAETAKLEARAVFKAAGHQGAGSVTPRREVPEVQQPAQPQPYFPEQMQMPAPHQFPQHMAPQHQPLLQQLPQQISQQQPQQAAPLAPDAATLARLDAAQRLSQRSQDLAQWEVTLNARQAAMEAQNGSLPWMRQGDTVTRGRSPSPAHFAAGFGGQAHAAHLLAEPVSYAAVPPHLTTPGMHGNFSPRYTPPVLSTSGVPDLLCRTDYAGDGSHWLGCARRQRV
mmetsp:Transcript_44503/g.81293  ORF Transcript_44503/g.81293 Transcript_44503/m.81293 type:complete len:600 (+) Transcript_44503:61-1860(+)